MKKVYLVMIATFREKDAGYEHEAYLMHKNIIESGLYKDYLYTEAEKVYEKIRNGEMIRNAYLEDVDEDKYIEHLSYKGYEFYCRESDRGVAHFWGVVIPPIHNDYDFQWTYSDYYNCFDTKVDYGYVYFDVHVNSLNEATITSRVAKRDRVHSVGEEIEVIKLNNANNDRIIDMIKTKNVQYITHIILGVQCDRNGGWTDLAISDMVEYLNGTGKYVVKEKVKGE